MRKAILLALAAVQAASALYAQRAPTMGWSSWNTFALNINEELIKSQADAMHQSGLQKAGYQFINIDDGYWDGRAENGHLRLNNKLFPSGMRSLVDYIHGLGLKAGIYSDAGDNTCGSGNRQAWGLGVGFAGHEEEDCKLYFRDWDFDFIKVDYCGGAHMHLDEQAQYTKISKAIKKCGKRIVYNICRWAYPGTWGAEVADSWRTTGDIYDAWKSVRGIIAENLYLSAYCHDGHYNDMDMLEVGRSMTQTEDETHFGMWCIMASPLLIGCDMTTLANKPATLALLTNRDLIALNQDPLHLQAYLADKQGECFLLVKDIKRLQGKERAFAIYNPSDSEQTYTLDFASIDLGGAVQLYDCIRQQSLGSSQHSYTFTLPAHGSTICRAKGEKRLERTRYEAAAAFLSQYQELRNNQAARTAIYSYKDEARCGFVAGWLGQSEANDLQWRDVCVKSAGKRRLTISYFSGDDRDMEVEVNGRHVATLRTHSHDWKERRSLSVEVTLRKGCNTVRLYNANGWMPDVECLTVGQ